MNANTQPFDFDQAIKDLDKANNIGSIEQLGDQIQHIWEIAQKLEFDESYQGIDKVVVAGMGGSALGTHIIQTVFKDHLKVPFIICGEYTLPRFVNEKTLVVASSYSGNTAETLSATKDAIQKKAKITGITSGGKLSPLLKEKKHPHLVFDAKYNPSNSPRMALGYSIFGQMVLFSKLGLLKISESDYKEVLEVIAEQQLSLSRHTQTDKNPAKLLAFQLKNRIPVITAAEHLEGVAHVFANQINENSKNYSEYRIVPELNHHLMEGLAFPENNDHNLLFLPLNSELYLAENQERMKLTQEVITENKLHYLSHTLVASTKLSQAFELLILASYTSYYLALLNNQDPTPNPWVDWFKEQLTKKDK